MSNLYFPSAEDINSGDVLWTNYGVNVEPLVKVVMSCVLQDKNIAMGVGHRTTNDSFSELAFKFPANIWITPPDGGPNGFFHQSTGEQRKTNIEFIVSSFRNAGFNGQFHFCGNAPKDANHMESFLSAHQFCIELNQWASANPIKSKKATKKA